MDVEVIETGQQAHEWQSEEYVAEWIGEDVMAEMLTFPRQLSAALVADGGVAVEHVVDLGSGAGPYLETFLKAFPKLRGTWNDSSEAMRAQATERLGSFGSRIRYVMGDMEDIPSLDLGECDVIVTSRVVHHFEHANLPGFYKDLFGLLRPGGFLFNLDHYATPDGWEQRYRRIREQFTGARQKPTHPHPVPFAPIDAHLEWLRQAGFEAPDVPWRTFFTALLAARKP